MTRQEAIRILMQSPLYFRFDLPARYNLVTEFCLLFTASSCPLLCALSPPVRP